MPSKMFAKLVLLHLLGILLLITKLNAIEVSATNILEVSRRDHVNKAEKVNQNNTYVTKMVPKSSNSDYVNETVSNGRQNTSAADCKQIFRCESGYNIYVMYTYYNRAFQIILFILFGIELKLTKIKAVLRKPIGPGITSFCCWIFAPLVSENAMRHSQIYIE